MTRSKVVKIAKARRWAASGIAREIREAAGVSSDEIAAALGVDGSTVRRWETGHRTPRSRYAAALYDLLAEVDTLDLDHLDEVTVGDDLAEDEVVASALRSIGERIRREGEPCPRCGNRTVNPQSARGVCAYCDHELDDNERAAKRRWKRKHDQETYRG